jgi:hypothetical protein
LEYYEGKEIPSKPHSYDTVEFGVISQKGIVEMLEQVFGASKKKTWATKQSVNPIISSNHIDY